MREPTLRQSADTVASFLARRRLALAVADIEANAENATAVEVRAAALASGVDARLLAAALRVRREFAPLDDLIRLAAAVALLSDLLEEGETLVSPPSLAAGEDPRRPFDVETSRRVAVLLLTPWAASDPGPRRAAVRALVRLAADTSRRRPELLVLGPGPDRFLETSKARVSWALERSPGLLRLFTEQFGDVTMTVAAFRAGPAARVRVVDVAPMLPAALAEEIAGPG